MAGSFGILERESPSISSFQMAFLVLLRQREKQRKNIMMN